MTEVERDKNTDAQGGSRMLPTTRAEHVGWDGARSPEGSPLVPDGCSGFVQGSDFEPPYVHHDGLCGIHEPYVPADDEEPF